MRLAGRLRAQGAQVPPAPMGFVIVLAIATEAPDVANCSSAVPCAQRRELADRAQKMCPWASHKGSWRQASQQTTPQAAALPERIVRHRGAPASPLGHEAALLTVCGHQQRAQDRAQRHVQTGSLRLVLGTAWRGRDSNGACVF